MENSLVYRFFKRPPVVFPLLALFLIGLTIYDITVFWGTDFTLIYRFHPLVVALYTVFWVAATFLKKWGGIAFILLTIINVAIYFLVNPDSSIIRRAFGDVLFPGVPLHLFMCMLILLYFKRLR